MTFRILLLVLFLFFFGLKPTVFADSVIDLIDKKEQFEKQKEIFEKLDKRQDENIIRHKIEKPKLLPKKV